MSERFDCIKGSHNAKEKLNFAHVIQGKGTKLSIGTFQKCGQKWEDVMEGWNWTTSTNYFSPTNYVQ